MYRYKVLKLADGTTRPAHRIIMEHHLGRPLTRHEVVHHKDGNGHNNDINNLELMSLSEHGSMHQKKGYRNAGHGRSRMYRIYKCRCKLCTAWSTERMRRYRQRKYDAGYKCVNNKWVKRGENDTNRNHTS